METTKVSQTDGKEAQKGSRSSWLGRKSSAFQFTNFVLCFGNLKKVYNNKIENRMVYIFIERV